MEEHDLGHGMKFISGFTDFEEAFELMRKQEQRANARLFPEQHAMIGCEEDQWYLNVAVDFRELVIVGEAWSNTRADKEELDSYGVKHVGELEEESRMEFISSRKIYAESRKRGYIFGRAWSTIEPRGELGSTHVANMWPITEAAFNETRDQKWLPDLTNNQTSPILRNDIYTFYVRLKFRQEGL